MTAGSRKFTLVEMLVVIAIIAILAALLMPSLRKAIDSARKMSCANNLRNLSAATHVYIDDNSQILMSTETRNNPINGVIVNFSDYQNWYANYLDAPINPLNPSDITTAMRSFTARVAICPSRDPLEMASGHALTQGKIYNLPYFTYAMFAYSASDRPITLGRLVHTFNRNKNASSGVSPAMWADKCQRSKWNGMGGFRETNHKLAYTGDDTGIPEGGNVSHADGHVKWLNFAGPKDSYVNNGTIIGSSTPIPINALFPNCDVNGAIRADQPYWIFGNRQFNFY